MRTFVDGLFDDGSCEKTSGCFRPDDHLRTRAEQSVDDRVEDERVESVDWRYVCKVAGVGERHGDVEAGHCQSGDEIATDV